ncbi:hypothetical protein Dsin_012549 [Dipteronia sinensis]|uniref:SWIM-type domain-containing protein n=1 Tax=Dipteronia sinensis TaxID=43782 RepID=A0AAE0AJF9_9ROSI|nr:hypothetical protein Dsin_012549 [Dipteronia sinensis]
MYGGKVGFSMRREGFGKNKKYHNHPLVMQKCTHMLPSPRKMANSHAIEVDLAEEYGISLKSSYELLVKLDNEEQITNMFWADARMIIDYGQFRDVVSFDTTYKINKENRPFAVFVGLNHHRETIIFGAALMYDKWAYAYVRHEWSAGMNTTQLSESFNASLKDYLKSDLNIAQFFIYFERVVNDKHYKELEAEYDLCCRLVDIKVHVKMLTQAREFYTKAIFEEFKVKFLEAIEFSLESCVDDDGSLLHIVTKDESFKKWLVKRNSDNLLSCSCRMFEMKGVLCSHVIKVLREAMNVKDIPDQYILKDGQNKPELNMCKTCMDMRFKRTLSCNKHISIGLCALFSLGYLAGLLKVKKHIM